ncbi:MAG: hypothetical protein Q8R16_00415 [bacterium]|nr:hypothetical protein [bacterium]
MPDDQWIRARIREVLERGHFMHLGISDDVGPWVCTLIYVHDDDFKIYWMSDPDVRHSKAVVVSTKAAAAITVSVPKETNLGIQISGVAMRIDVPRHDLAVKHLVKRGHPPPSETDDVLQGDTWYELRPTMIDLIDEKNFGFEKQRLTL